MLRMITQAVMIVPMQMDERPSFVRPRLISGLNLGRICVGADTERMCVTPALVLPLACHTLAHPLHSPFSPKTLPPPIVRASTIDGAAGKQCSARKKQPKKV